MFEYEGLRTEWLVAYTAPRREKQIAKLLHDKNIQFWLPLRKELRQWSDRKKWVELPLFPSYIFIKTSPKLRDYALQTPGISRWLRHNGKNVIISDNSMDAIQSAIEMNPFASVVDQMPQPGETYTINDGPLKGMTGKIIEIRNKKSLVIQIAELDKCLVLPFEQSS